MAATRNHRDTRCAVRQVGSEFLRVARVQDWVVVAPDYAHRRLTAPCGWRQPPTRNASTLRRAYATYASTHPGDARWRLRRRRVAELGEREAARAGSPGRMAPGTSPRPRAVGVRLAAGVDERQLATTASGCVAAKSRATAPPMLVPTSCTGAPPSSCSQNARTCSRMQSHGFFPGSDRGSDFRAARPAAAPPVDGAHVAARLRETAGDEAPLEAGRIAAVKEEHRWI